MSDLNGILSIAGQALTTQQQAISVTSHNIANVNTPGYSRQKLVMTTSPPVDSAIGPMGNGVDAVEIERIYDRFVNAQIINENKELGRWDAQQNSVESLEMIFNEANGYGLSEAMPRRKRSWPSAIRAWWRTPRFHPLSLVQPNIGVFGVHLLHLGNKESILESAMAQIFEGVANGELRVVLDRVVSFDREGAVEAHRYLHARKNLGKVVLST